MLDQENVAKATEALSTALAALLEHDVAAPSAVHDFMTRAEQLKHVSDDAMVLIAALIVLARRSSAEEIEPPGSARRVGA